MWQAGTSAVIPLLVENSTALWTSSAWCFLLVFSMLFLQITLFLFTLLCKTVHQAVSNSCSPDGFTAVTCHLEFPKGWPIRKHFIRFSFLSEIECLLSVFMDTAGTSWYFWGEGWEFEAVQVGNDEEVVSMIFNGELSAGNLCCSFMCWVAVQVFQQTFHIWIFCCWTWLPTHCSDYCSAALPAACPAFTLWVFSLWLNEGQSKSLSQFRQYMHFWIFGLVTWRVFLATAETEDRKNQVF